VTPDLVHAGTLNRTSDKISTGHDRC
jgi:hypothetical protein